MKRREFLKIGTAGSGVLVNLLAGSSAERVQAAARGTRDQAKDVFPPQGEQGTGNRQVRPSLLVAQVGYHPSDSKRAYLRSLSVNPPDNPTGQRFQVIDKADDSVGYAGTVELWGERWGSWWWVLDFSPIRKEGSYFIRLGDRESSVFKIHQKVFINEHLTMVALDQLDSRIVTRSFAGREVTIYHDCAALVTAEVQAVGAVVHGLADMYENKSLYGSLTPEYQRKLIKHLILGADYLVASQLTTSDPETNGTFVHSLLSLVAYKIPEEKYPTQVFNEWQDMALCIPVLVRALIVLKDVGGSAEKMQSYRTAAEKACERAALKPFYSAYGRRVQNDPKLPPSLDVGLFVRKVYNQRDPAWTIPADLRVREMLPFVWGCTLLYEETGQQKYLTRAREYADLITARQFVDWENPIEGAFGTFYDWKGDDTAFLPEQHQFHGWNLGATTPTNLKGFIDLIRLCPESPKLAAWYNVVKTYGDHYVKKTAELNPFKIYPVGCYRDPDHGGVKFFQVYAHGSMGGHYGQIAKFLMELGDFLNDSSFQELANQNTEFIVGLNAGFPTTPAYDEWYAISLIKDVGVRFFDRPALQGDPNLIRPRAPDGSGFNGFSAYPQFEPGWLADASDRPAGILKPDGSFYFNEDWILHSHAYVSAVCRLEGAFALTLQTCHEHQPVVANVTVHLKENAASHQEGSYHFQTGADGGLSVNDLPLQTRGTITASYRGTSLSKPIETLGSGHFKWEIDFANAVDVTMTSPELVAAGETATATITVANRGSRKATSALRLSASGVDLKSNEVTVELEPGKVETRTVGFTAGEKVMPYLIAASVNGVKNITRTVAGGRVASGKRG